MTQTAVSSLRSLALPIYGPAILYAMAQAAVTPMTPIIASRMGASPAQSALAVLAVVSGSIVGSIPGSVLTSRIGERAVLPLAACTAALSLAVAWWAPTLLILGLALLLFGACGAVFQLARQAYLTENVEFALRARALSTLGGVFRIGMFIGPFLGAAAIELAGLHAVFPVAILASLAAGAVSLTLPGSVDVDNRASRRHLTGSAATKVSTILSEHRTTFACMGLAVGLLAAVRYSRNVAPPLWADYLEMEPQVASMIIGVASAVDMLVFYPAGRVMDRWGRRAVAVPTMGFMALGLAMMPLTAGWPGLLATAVVVGFGNGIGSGIVMTFGADLSPDIGRHQFLGIFRVIGDVGGLLGPLLLSALTGWFGLRFGIWAVAGLSAVGAVLMAVMIPFTYRRRQVPYQGTRARNEVVAGALEQAPTA